MKSTQELKQVVTIGITPTSLQRLEAIAIELGISRSEVIERFVRHIDSCQFDIKDLADYQSA